MRAYVPMCLCANAHTNRQLGGRTDAIHGQNAVSSDDFQVRALFLSKLTVRHVHIDYRRCMDTERMGRARSMQYVHVNARIFHVRACICAAEPC